MYLSGTLGFELFKFTINDITCFILLLSDMHSGVKYCDKQSNNISKFLKSREKDSNVLLEETTLPEAHLKDLWPNAIHTQELKKLAFESKHINSFDIRPLLVPFSWELIDVDKSLGNTILDKYLFLINSFFFKESLLYKKYIIPELNKNIIFEKKNKLHLLEIFDQYTLFLKQNKKYLSYTLSELKKNHIGKLHKINDIIGYIMEWYMILLILNNNRNSIVHAGLAHTENVSKLLNKFYKFELLESKGFNKLEDIYNIEEPMSCIFIPNQITDKFSKKFNFLSNFL